MPDPTAFTEWGYLGALLFLVVIFGFYLDKRDRSNKDFIERRDMQWQKFLEEQRKVDNSAIIDLTQQVKSLAEQLVQLRADFNDHNTWERTKLEAMTRPARGKVQ